MCEDTVGLSSDGSNLFRRKVHGVLRLENLGPLKGLLLVWLHSLKIKRSADSCKILALNQVVRVATLSRLSWEESVVVLFCFVFPSFFFPLRGGACKYLRHKDRNL